MSTETVGAGVRAAPVAASVSTPVVPCTVRNSCAGDSTPALNGQGRAVEDSPSAIVNATRLGSLSVFSVARNAVAVVSGLTRSSTRLAALLAYTGSVG